DVRRPRPGRPPDLRRPPHGGDRLGLLLRPIRRRPRSAQPDGVYGRPARSHLVRLRRRRALSMVRRLPPGEPAGGRRLPVPGGDHPDLRSPSRGRGGCAPPLRAAAVRRSRDADPPADPALRTDAAMTLTVDSEGWSPGACHCRAVRFLVRLKGGLEQARRCDCSLCRMRGAVTLSASLDNLEVLAGAEALTEYRFNTGLARHFFCSPCGIYTHHRRRSNPNEYGVNAACLEGLS